MEPSLWIFHLRPSGMPLQFPIVLLLPWGCLLVSVDSNCALETVKWKYPFIWVTQSSMEGGKKAGIYSHPGQLKYFSWNFEPLESCWTQNYGAPLPWGCPGGEVHSCWCLWFLPSSIPSSHPPHIPLISTWLSLSLFFSLSSFLSIPPVLWF